MPKTTNTAENYSAEDEKILRSTYDPKASQDERDAQVTQLAELLGGRKTRSIVAKLSNMKLYVAKVRTTKTGAPVEHKKDIVADIAKSLGVKVADIASAGKATKATLQVIAVAAESTASALRDLIESVKEDNEQNAS